MAHLDVLIPTFQRAAAVAVTLASLAFQDYHDFRVVVSDQGDTQRVESAGPVAAVARVLDLHGNRVELLDHRPRLGLAEHRQFLLDQVRSPLALFLDDDVVLEPWVLGKMVEAITEEGCGFVGSSVIGLSYLDDVRPHEQGIEFWTTGVTPERVTPDTPAWQRHRLHNAANLHHVARQMNLGPDHVRRYRVAWVGGCVLYDTAALRAAGGFSFWRDLPQEHCGEDVLAQLRVMARSGGCGLIPSGVYHQELPTTVSNRRVDAPRVLPIGLDEDAAFDGASRAG